MRGDLFKYVLVPRRVGRRPAGRRGRVRGAGGALRASATRRPLRLVRPIGRRRDQRAHHRPVDGCQLRAIPAAPATRLRLPGLRHHRLPLQLRRQLLPTARSGLLHQVFK